MRLSSRILFLAACCIWVTAANAQNSSSATMSTAAVATPPLIRYSGTITDAAVRHAGAAGAIFSLYDSESGGTALWTESESLQVGPDGRYTVLLGANTREGVPVGLFVSGEARWLGISIDGTEQPRLRLVNVPYALKAGDADTVGGMSASQIAAQAAAMVGTTTVAPNSVVSPSGTAPLIRNSSGSLITTTAAAAGATNFSANTTDQVVTVTQSGTGAGVVVQVPTGSGKIISGQVNGTELFAVNNLGTVIGKGLAFSNSTNSSVFSAVNTSTVPTDTAVTFVASASNGLGKAFQGNQFSTTGNTVSIYGLNYSTTGTGVLGLGNATTGANVGVWGLTKSTGGTGVLSQVPVGAKLFSGVTTAVGEVFSVSSAGAVNGTSFTGSGAGLTSLNLTGTYANALNLTNASNVYYGSGSHLSGVVTGGVAYAGSGLAYNLTSGTLSYTLQTTCNAGDVLRWTGSAWVCDGNLAKRSISIVIGCDTCGALQDTDSQSAVYVNNATPMTITSIACYSDTASAPSINVDRDDGTPADILTSSLVCSNTTSGASSTSFTGGETTLNVGDKLNFKMVTAGGAHRVTVVVSAKVN